MLKFKINTSYVCYNILQVKSNVTFLNNASTSQKNTFTIKAIVLTEVLIGSWKPDSYSLEEITPSK